MTEDQSDNYRRFAELHVEADRKGWRVPVNDVFPRHSWIAYWEAMQRYERDPSGGRPVPPHRSA